jgi:glucokinase
MTTKNVKSMEVGIGIDMGGTRIKIGLVHEGVLVATRKIPAAAHVTLEQRLAEIAVEADRMLAENNCTPTGVGIAFPGIVDSDNNRILSKYVKYPDARRVDLSGWAQKQWGIPLALENDARAALVGEWQYGAGKNCDNLVLITLGTGVGSAALIHGKLLKGKHYHAGNLGGHIAINLHGTECNCGSVGCVESEASTWALEKQVTGSPDYKASALASEKEINFNTVFTWAEKGDALAIQIRENCLKAWATGILNLILSYDPERVVIGGGIMQGKNLLIPQVRRMIERDSWINDIPIELVVAEQVEYAGILGMYYLLSLLQKDYKPVL